MPSTPVLAADAFFDLLIPLSQPVIGILVLVAVVISVHRLLRRGPSRMVGAMLLIGATLVGLAVITYVVQEI